MHLKKKREGKRHTHDDKNEGCQSDLKTAGENQRYTRSRDFFRLMLMIFFENHLQTWKQAALTWRSPQGQLKHLMNVLS
jgi:hypothetical protein